MTERDDEHGPGGMDAIPDDPIDDSEEPGGMSAIPDADADADADARPREPREQSE